MSSLATPDDSPKENVELRFAEVYKSPEWQNLNEVDRSQLLMVAEGVKPGTIIGGDFTNFQGILDKLGLEASLNSEPGQLYPVYKVAKPEVLAQYFREILTIPESSDIDAFHRVNGKFLGYPECCTEEYNNPRKNAEARKKYSPRKFISNFEYELKKMIDETGTYPEEFDFTPPSFTPCGAHCEAAIAQLRKWKAVVEAGDPKAARELQLYRWANGPQKKIHQQEIDKIDSEGLLEYKIAQMRNEILGSI